MPIDLYGAPKLETVIGPCYDQARLLRLWRAANGSSRAPNLAALIPLPASDGRKVYPTQHFVHPAHPWPAGPLPGLGQVHEVLASAGASALTCAKWLALPDQRFADLSALQWLRTHESSDVVICAATLDAARWRT